MNKDDATGRNDERKLRYDLVPVYWRKILAQVFTFGAKKFGDWRWIKGRSYSRMLGSLHRHIAAWEAGERYDEESGLPHLAHAAWNALALEYYEEFKRGDDDRISHDEDKIIFTPAPSYSFTIDPTPCSNCGEVIFSSVSHSCFRIPNPPFDSDDSTEAAGDAI